MKISETQANLLKQIQEREEAFKRMGILSPHGTPRSSRYYPYTQEQWEILMDWRERFAKLGAEIRVLLIEYPKKQPERLDHLLYCPECRYRTLIWHSLEKRSRGKDSEQWRPCGIHPPFKSFLYKGILPTPESVVARYRRLYLQKKK